MKILRFKTFDFLAFKSAYSKRCEEQRDTRKVLENNMARANTADFVEYGWISPEELDTMPVLTDADAPVIRKVIRKTQSERRLMEKTAYLMDEIIYGATLNAKDAPEKPLIVSMNASLMKEVVGRDYVPILEAYKELNYIKVEKEYDIGEARIYEVIDGIEEVDCPREMERKVREYREKTTAILTRMKDEEMVKTLTRARIIDNPKATDASSAKFIARYTTGLNKIRIADEEGLNKAIPELKAKAEKELNDKGNPKDPESIRIYFDAIARALREEKSIYEIDFQGRIYHLFTGLKRELKKYLTIDFSLDCKNSHPLLFNYIIYKTRYAKPTMGYEMSLMMHKLFNEKEERKGWSKYHYSGKYIRKYLNNNGINSLALAYFTDDLLMYIYETSNGIFWDNICEEHPEFDRNSIKKKLFEEVFYSHKTRMVYKKKSGERIEKEYGKAFRKRYPNAYRVIADWKHPEKHEEIQKYISENGISTTKPSTSLSLAMMSLESRIFTSVLESLYRKRYYAISIHDCIVIPQTGNTHQPTREEVERLLLKEYAKYGLIPTFKEE